MLPEFSAIVARIISEQGIVSTQPGVVIMGRDTRPHSLELSECVRMGVEAFGDSIKALGDSIKAFGDSIKAFVDSIKAFGDRVFYLL